MPVLDPSWWSVGVPASMVGLYVLKFLVERDQRVKIWEKSAKAICRDDQVRTSAFLAPRRRVTVHSGPNEARIRDCRTIPESVVVEIEGPEGFSALNLHRQLFKPRTREIEVGDEELDDALVIEGPAPAVAARLDGALRSRILSALTGCPEFEISGGTLRAEVKDKDLRRILPILFDIGEQLAKPVSVERQIARNAVEDENPGVRLFNLLLLAREHPGDPATLDVLRQACSDKSAEVRLRAAIELGEEARPVLEKLAEKSVDDKAASQAVTLLGDSLSFSRLEKILARSRDKDLPRTSIAVLEQLGGRGAEAVGLLSSMVAKGKGDLTAAAARALGATGEASAEAPLLQALQSEDGMVREAAAAALGRVGTAAAVPLLKEAGEVSWLARDLRRATRQAIAEIQSRLEGLPGQLSLAEVEGGGLSLASDDAGHLSLAPHMEGDPENHRNRDRERSGRAR